MGYDLSESASEHLKAKKITGIGEQGFTKDNSLSASLI